MKFVASIILEAIDKVSNPMKSAKSAISSFQNKMVSVDRAIKEYNRHQKEFREGFETGLGGKLFEIASIGAVIEFGKSSVEAFNESGAAIANVEAGLKSTKNAAGKTAEELEKSAKGLMKTSFFDDDEILQNVTAQMLTFTNITGSRFDRAEQAVLNVTTKLRGLNATGEDLRGVAIQLSKALNEPVQNLSALSRSGIQFSDSQKKVIKALWESGQHAKAQGLILDEIEKQYGNSAQTLAETEGGKQKQIANQIANTMETIGGMLAPIQLKAMNIIESLLERLNVLLEWAGKNKDTVINIGGAVATFAGTVWLLNSALKAWAAIQEIVNLVMSANPVAITIMSIALLAAGVFLLIRNWAVVKQFFKNLWQGITDIFKKAWDFVWNILLNNKHVQAALIAFAPFIGIPLLIIKNWKSISGFFSNLWAGIVQAFNKAVTFIESLLPGWLKDLFSGKKKEITVNTKPTGAKLQTGSQISKEFYSSQKVERSELRVRFDNVPTGTKIQSGKNNKNLDLSMGYAGVGF